MSSKEPKQSKVDSDVALSLEDYRLIVNEDSNSRKEYSKVGHLYLREILLNFDGLKLVLTED